MMSQRGNISLFGATLNGSARQLSQPVSHILTQPQASQPALTASQPHPYLHSLKPASHILIQPQASQPHPYTASSQPATSLYSSHSQPASHIITQLQSIQPASQFSQPVCHILTHPSQPASQQASHPKIF